MKGPQERLRELERQIKQQQITPIQKILFIILFCFSVVLIGAYISFLMGSRYFLIGVLYSASSELASKIVSTALFIANTFFVIYFSLNLRVKKSALLSLCYVPLFVVTQMLPIGKEFKTLFLPLLYTTVCYFAFDRSSVKLFVIRLLKINVIIPIYQIIANAIKYDIVSLAFQIQSISIISKLFYSFDYYLFMSAIIMWKAVKQYGLGLQLVVVSKDIETPILDNEDREAIKQFKQLNGLNKAKACIALFMVQIAQTALVLCACKIGNVFIEGSIVAFASIISGQYIKRRWHSPQISVCTLIAVFSTFIGARTPPTAKFSILIFVVIGISITYMLYRVTFIGEGSLPSAHKHVELTDREKRVLELRERGWKIEDIAAEIYVHRRTVDRILKSIKSKTSQ